MKINSLARIREIETKLLNSLVTDKRVPYFSLLVDNGDCTLSHCFFSPVVRKHIMVNDYVTIMKLLLEHPNISSLTYDEKTSVISALYNPKLKEFVKELNPEEKERRKEDYRPQGIIDHTVEGE